MSTVAPGCEFKKLSCFATKAIIALYDVNRTWKHLYTKTEETALFLFCYPLLFAVASVFISERQSIGKVTLPNLHSSTTANRGNPKTHIWILIDQRMFIDTYQHTACAKKSRRMLARLQWFALWPWQTFSLTHGRPVLDISKPLLRLSVYSPAC